MSLSIFFLVSRLNVIFLRSPCTAVQKPEVASLKHGYLSVKPKSIAPVIRFRI